MGFSLVYDVFELTVFLKKNWLEYMNHPIDNLDLVSSVYNCIIVACLWLICTTNCSMHTVYYTVNILLKIIQLGNSSNTFRT